MFFESGPGYSGKSAEFSEELFSFYQTNPANRITTQK